MTIRLDVQYQAYSQFVRKKTSHLQSASSVFKASMCYYKKLLVMRLSKIQTKYLSLIHI